VKFHTVPLEDRREVGAYTLLSYRWEDGPVEPGQFAMARAAGYPITFDPFLARPFSFYDYDDGVASLLFDVRGRGTALLDAARQSIEVSVPLGRGFDFDAASGRVALLGGGIGVAPLKVLSRKLEGLGIEHDVFLGFAGARAAVVAGEFPGAVVATMDGTAGARGTVLDVVPDLDAYTAFYACGPNPMLAAVKRAVEGRGVCQLSVEERMGCGNGSCNGCAVLTRRGYVRSCIEGPVFAAEVLAW
jgi:dihydroorotate dehydrogenase electron transfer subunit